MVSSNSRQIRGLCSNIFVQFLLDYPLQNERVEQHLNFVLKNLSYEQPENRIQLLGTLGTLIERLPAAVVEIYGELLFFTLLLRVVVDEDTECRQQAQTVTKRLIFSGKISNSKMKTMLNTVLQMGSSDPEKQQQLRLAKTHALQMIAQSGKNRTNKLKAAEIHSIVSALSEDTLKTEIGALQSKVERTAEKEQEKVQKDSSGIDLKARSFLQAIDLIGESDGDAGEEAELAPEAEGEQTGTLLFHALSCLEALMEHQAKAQVVTCLTDFGVPRGLFLLTRHHHSYWIRLISHRLLGHIFAYQRESKVSLITIFGLDIPEQLIELAYDLIEGLRKPVYTQDMQDQLVKNLLFLLNTLVEQSRGPNANAEVKNAFKLDKLFRKASYIGRRVMLDIKTSQDRLEAILKFFKLAL